MPTVRVAAWVEWAGWICKRQRLPVHRLMKRPRRETAGAFLFVRGISAGESAHLHGPECCERPNMALGGITSIQGLAMVTLSPNSGQFGVGLSWL